MPAWCRPRALPPALALLFCAAQMHLSRCALPQHKPLLRGHSGSAVLPAGTRVLQQDTSGSGLPPILWFFGAPVTVSHIGQGETLQWVWWDQLAHSVEGQGPNALLFSGKGGGNNTVAGNGFTYNFTFDEPGEYPYQCHVHREIMTGTVVVKPRVNIGGVTIPWYDGVSFGGASAIIEEGDKVTWQWEDDLDHSLVSGTGDKRLFTGPGGSGNPVTGQGFQYKKTFTKVGVYPYFCGQHGDTMSGNITVLAKGSLAPTRSPLGLAPAVPLGTVPAAPRSRMGPPLLAPVAPPNGSPARSPSREYPAQYPTQGPLGSPAELPATAPQAPQPPSGPSGHPRPTSAPVALGPSTQSPRGASVAPSQEPFQSPSGSPLSPPKGAKLNLVPGSGLATVAALALGLLLLLA